MSVCVCVREIDRQKDRQTDRQKDRQTETETETYREANKIKLKNLRERDGEKKVLYTSSPTPTPSSPLCPFHHTLTVTKAGNTFLQVSIFLSLSRPPTRGIGERNDKIPDGSTQTALPICFRTVEKMSGINSCDPSTPTCRSHKALL